MLIKSNNIMSLDIVRLQNQINILLNCDNINVKYAAKTNEIKVESTSMLPDSTIVSIKNIIYNEKQLLNLKHINLDLFNVKILYDNCFNLTINKNRSLDPLIYRCLLKKLNLFDNDWRLIGYSYIEFKKKFFTTIITHYLTHFLNVNLCSCSYFLNCICGDSETENLQIKLYDDDFYYRYFPTRSNWTKLYFVIANKYRTKNFPIHPKCTPITYSIHYKNIIKTFRHYNALRHINNSPIIKKQIEAWRHSLWEPDKIMSQIGYSMCSTFVQTNI